MKEKQQAASFASKVRALREMEGVMADWPAVRVRVLRNYTLENLEPLIRAECARSKIRAEVSFSDFDTFEQEVLDSASVTNTGGFDLVMVAIWSDALLSESAGDTRSPTQVADRITRLLDELQQRVSAAVCVTTLLPPMYALGGAVTPKASSSLAATIETVNDSLSAYARSHPRVHLVDLGKIVARIGESAAFDRRFWYLYRAPFRNEALDELAKDVAALALAAKGATKKVLVLDCDNTLWGGIIGEDGMEGIALDPNSYPGNAFYDFQRQIKSLKERGVILALCSKNNEEDALAVFDSHAGSLLKRDDFACWQIGWGDKAAGLREIVRTLNVGMDSVVFIDDSAAECELIRQQIPEATVLRAPANAFELPALLRDYRGFDRLAESDEDSRRTQLYLDERKREEAKQGFTDLNEYLRSLDLVVEARPARPEEVVRVAQLTQKTNQFNLTTKRYSEADIERMMASERHTVLAMRVRDRFGDYGLSGVGIVERTPDAARIDTLLMSCRVLGRQAELVLLSELVAAGRKDGSSRTVIGDYLPTKKNQQVQDFYERAGFVGVDGDKATANGGRTFMLRPESALAELPDYIKVEK